MGLDTVELIVSFEKHFGVEITDSAAASISTVGEMAAWLGQQLGTTQQRGSVVRETVAAQLRQLFAPMLGAEATPLLQLLPNHAAQARYATQLLARHSLKLPELQSIAPPRPTDWLARLFGSNQLPPKPAVATSTLGDLIDWTIALNYEQLLRPPYRSQYEVEQSVIGLTSDKCGVEVPEIRLSSSFTNDLGMD
jgi:acyl carrier protein